MNKPKSNHQIDIIIKIKSNHNNNIYNDNNIKSKSKLDIITTFISFY